jgi:hypothetical protein
MLASYNDILTAVRAVAEDDSQEFIDYIPTAIFLAEQRISRDFDYQNFDVMVANVPINLDTETVTTGIADNTFLYFKHVFYNGKKLDQVDVSFIREINRFETTPTNDPRYYAFFDDPNTLYISPKVDTGNFEIMYTKKPDPLSAINATNEILGKAPDALFCRTMYEMAVFMKHPEMSNAYLGEYRQILESVLNLTRRERTDVGQSEMAEGVNTQSSLRIQ